MAKVTLKIERRDASFFDQGIPNRPNRNWTLQLRASVEKAEHCRYVIVTGDGSSERSIEKDDAVVIVIRKRTDMLTPQAAEDIDDIPDTVDRISYAGSWDMLFTVAITLSQDDFESLERRIATHDLPSRAFLEFAPQGPVWDTYAQLDLRLTSSGFYWPLHAEPSGSDNRSPTREQLKLLLTEIRSQRRWIAALFWTFLVVALIRWLSG